MGALNRIPRIALAVGLAAVAAVGVTACEGGGGLGSAAVGFTTDEAVTDELERRKADVRWLTCTASFGDREGRSAGSTASENPVASVDCQGETRDGKEITADGKVTHAVNGACVRGDITAKVDGKQLFRVEGLGDCDSKSPPRVGDPTHRGPGPTVTVTVTTTVWCDQYPSCRPVEGK